MPPSFVFVLADDLGYADLGCYGARAPGTPCLDRLAAEGLRFTDGYANSPVCSPTRFALMTGRYQYRLRGAAEEPIAGRARGRPDLGLPPGHPTLPSLLRDAGYATALAGKWHLGYLPTSARSGAGTRSPSVPTAAAATTSRIATGPGCTTCSRVRPRSSAPDISPISSRTGPSRSSGARAAARLPSS